MQSQEDKQKRNGDCFDLAERVGRGGRVRLRPRYSSESYFFTLGVLLVKRPRLLKLLLAFWCADPCCGGAGVDCGRPMLAAELGLNPTTLALGAVLAAVSRAGVSSSSCSAQLRPFGRPDGGDGLCARRAFSCVVRNFSNSSFHLMPGSSRDLRRLGRSKVDTLGVVGFLQAFVSERILRD